MLPEYPQSNLDPCLNINRPPYYQSVYSCSSYPVEPYQQMFPWQSGSYLGQFDSATVYNVEINSGTDNAYFYKVGYWDTLSNVQVDPEYIGSSLTGLTGVELAGWGEYRVYHGIGVWEREHFALYNIRFDNFDLQTAYVTVRITNLNTNVVTEWHTTIVNPQFALVNLGIAGDTVLHKRAVEVTPELDNVLQYTCYHFGYGSCPPDNVTFSIEILEGEGYGTIGRYDRNNEYWDYSNSFTSLSYDDIYRNYLFYYQATGQQPDSTAVVKIKQSSSDTDIGSIDYTFYVKRNFLPPVSENGSIVIETNKNTAMPGDTLDVLLRWEDGSNGIVDFADWQEFAVWFADGFDYGTILNAATSDTSDSFEMIGKEFKLLVNQNITDANAKIVIAAETEVAMLGEATIMQSKNQNHLERKEIKVYRTAKTQDKEDKENGGPTIDIVIGSKYLSGVKEIFINPFIVEIDPPTISAGDTAKIIPKYVNENGDTVQFTNEQTFELGMLDGCVLGKLSNAGIDTNYFYGITQPFYFIADSSAESGTVLIRAGLVPEISASKPIINGTEQKNKINTKTARRYDIILDKYKTASANTNNNINAFLEANLENEFCYTGIYEAQDYGFGDVVVENECDFENCGDSYDDIQITLLTQPNVFQHAIYQLILENGSVKGAVVDVDTTTVCELDSANIKNGVVGQSTPVPYSRLRKNTSNNWEKSWILSPCKNDTGAIEYRTITKDSIRTSIYLDFVADVCYDLIAADTSNLTFVNDTTALKDTSIVKDATIALHDICGHRCYPQIVSKDGYIFKEIVYLHELQHRNHYKDIIDSLKQKYLIDKIKLDFTNDCKTFSQTIKNAESDSSSFESKIKQYVQEATIEYHIQSGLEYKINGSVVVPANLSKEESNEKKRHSAQIIKDLVNTYLFSLHNYRGTPWQVTTCMTCP